MPCQEPESLYDACKKNDIKSVHNLIKAGAELEPTTDKPLHIAIEVKHKEIVSMLIAAGASTETKDADGYRSIHIAAKNGDIEILEMIIAATEDIDIQSDNGKTALHCAVRGSNNKLQVIETLIQAGASALILDEEGLTCSQDAIRQEDHDVVVLLRSGAAADINATTTDKPLHIAIEVKHKEIVSMLIAAGAFREAKDANVYPSIHLAAIHGNIENLKMIIAATEDINIQSDNGDTALHFALRQPDTKSQVIETLVQAGASTDIRDKNGSPSIHLAAKNGNIEILKMIISATEDIDIECDEGRTALLCAVQQSNPKLQVIETLIQAGASPEIVDKGGFSCLFYAVTKKTNDVMNLLLGRNAAVNIYGKEYLSPALYAVRLERFDMLQLLYNAGADFDPFYPCNNKVSTEIKRPPTYEMLNFFHTIGASVYSKSADLSVFDSPLLPKEVPPTTKLMKQPTLLKELILKGFNPNTRQTSGRTLLHVAVVQNNLQVLRILIYAGANANTRDDAGLSPLDSALSSDDESLINLLLTSNADMNNYHGPYNKIEQNRHLHWAASKAERLHLFKILIKRGANVNVLNSLRETPLHVAIKMKNVRAAQSLIAVGCKSNLRAEGGFTPLHYAVQYMSPNIVKMLVKAGASINCRDKHNQPPLYYAIKASDVAAVRILINAGAHVEDTSNYQNAVFTAAKMDDSVFLRALLGNLHNDNDTNKNEHGVYGFKDLIGRTVLEAANGYGSTTVNQILQQSQINLFFTFMYNESIN